MDWGASVRPLLAAAYGNVASSDLLKLARTISNWLGLVLIASKLLGSCRFCYTISYFYNLILKADAKLYLVELNNKKSCA